MLPLSAVAQPRSFSEDSSDSVAVIIGNKNYRYAKSFPVEYAINDANAIREYLMRFLRFEERNIIFEPDATKGVLEEIFKPQGRLIGLVREGRSNVFVFYSGHGVPDVVGRQPYLLPVDMKPDSPEDGYSLETLYQNLDRVKQKIGPDHQVIVMIDACFTGETGRGERFVSGTSAPGFAPALPRNGNGLIKLVATSGTHPANWDEKLGLGLFTSRFLMGVAGLADAPGRGVIQWSELRKYVLTTVDIDARRLSGGAREQVPEIVEANLTLPVGEVAAVRPGILDARDDIAWRTGTDAATVSPDDYGKKLAYQNYIVECKQQNRCGHLDEAEQRLKDIRDRQNVAEDRANWARLSAAGKFQEYIRTCIEPCAYRKFADEEIRRLQVAVAPEMPAVPRNPPLVTPPPFFTPPPPVTPPVTLAPVTSRSPCQADRLISWLAQRGAYGGDRGDQPFDTFAYDDQVNWIVNGKQSWKTRQEIAKEEEDFRKAYPLQKYSPTTLSVDKNGEQCVLTQQLESDKVSRTGRSVHSTFKVTFTIRTDANGPRSIVGHQIDVLPSQR
jgi:hypothetical protein